MCVYKVKQETQSLLFSIHSFKEDLFIYLLSNQHVSLQMNSNIPSIIKKDVRGISAMAVIKYQINNLKKNKRIIEK